MDPASATTLRKKADAALRAGRLPEAREALERLCADPAADAGDWLQLATVFGTLGDAAGIERCSRQALARKPTLPEAHANLAMALASQGRLNEAAGAYRQALALNPRDAGLHNSLGTVLGGLGRAPEAAACYQEAIRLQPDLAEAHYNLGNLLYGARRLPEAERCYRAATQRNPRYAQAHNNLGAVLLDLQQPAKAVTCFETALKLDPAYVMAWNNLGNARSALKEWPAAEAAYQKAIDLRSDFALAHFNLANARIAQNKTAEAEASLREALRHRPDYPAALNNLGNLLIGAERGKEAIEWLERALRLQPKHPAALNNLGRALTQLGRKDEAAARFRAALEIQPDLAEAHFNLANHHLGRQEYEPAVHHAREALRHKPNYSEAFNTLGNALFAAGKRDEAIATYQQALALKPDDISALCNIGLVYQDLSRMDEAIACFHRALEIEPQRAELYHHLGNTLRMQGLTEEAAAAYDRALEIEPNDAIRIRRATLMPIIMESGAAITQWRDRYEREVRALLDVPLALTDPPKQINATNFYLAYHGLNNRDLQKLSAELYRHACPSLDWTAPHCRAGDGQEPKWRGEQGRSGAARPLRVGFISMFMRQHSIGKTTRGLVANLDRDRFRVYSLFLPRAADDEIARFIRDRSDEAHEIPLELDIARERIAALELDILFYQDIGMDPFTYFLSFARLAPIQCLSFGHPDTTGVPNMDWWVSNDLFEPDHAQDHYSEKLFLLHDLGTLAYYYRPQIPQALKPRAAFELPEDAHVYLCPQTLFKVHPDFDAIVAGILRADPKAVVAFIQPWIAQWAKLLRARMARLLGADSARVVFVPRQGQDADFLNLLAAADVILDTPHFNGMNTSLESFAVGTPVVTLPGQFQRGRHTYGMYRSPCASQPTRPSASRCGSRS